MKDKENYLLHEIVLPQIRRDLTSCLIVAWLKEEGQRIKRGNSLLVMETVKATIELQAEVSGTLTGILQPAGEWICVPATVGIITLDLDEKVE